MNIAEKTAGFAISGDTASEAGVSITVAIGTGSLSATSADDNGTATWSVSVPADASYITGTSVNVTASATKTGFTAPGDVQRTLTVDLTAPTAPTYTAPALLKVGVAITATSPSGGSGIDAYSATGLPPGLSIDTGTGAIGGTPAAADANTADATVTVSDAAGNSAEVSITFPAVAKGDQTLTGFQYSASSVTLLDTAPTVTAPTGVQTILSYSATPSTACTVNSSSGILTLAGVGNCVITATAAGTDDYNEATATFTVAVRVAGALVLNLDAIAEDNTVNIAEKTAGFAISGDTASEAGVSITVAIGTGSLSATSADDNGTATWSVSVPADASYITGTSVVVAVNATKTGYTSPSAVQRTLTVDLTAPTAPTYTAPSSLTVGTAIAAMSPSGGSGIDAYGATGLPPGLSIDTGTGAIGGTPVTAQANTADATVTVSDAAGNTVEVSIAFPAVAKGDQTLTGFQYGASSVAFGSAAPAVSAPSGAQGALSYSATPTAVCTVDPSSGALTLAGAGSCEITATAAGTANYDEATATFTVTVQAAGALVLNLDAVAADNTVNIAKKAVGFTISGDTGTESGVDVTVQIGTETLTATSADNAGTATWSVSVPAGANYITGTSLDVTVSATKTGFTAPGDVQRTLTVDLTAPTAPTYTAPGSLQVGVVIAAMSPSGGIGIDAYGATGLPPGLSIDTGTGVIGGTPDTADANTADATVTVSDAAGNTVEVSIAFPAVAKGDQTLTGFQYSASSVTFGSTAPTVTAPAGAQTTLSYSATPSSVCTVDPSSGALTLVGAGSCEITATAAGTDDYNEATATYTVTVQAAGALVLSLDTIAGDDALNIQEKAAGFAISGDTGLEAGVSVTVAIGTGSLSATSADNAGTATWSVSVPADASYITGTSVAVEVNASKTGYASPSAVHRALTVDLTAPTAPTYTAPGSLKVGVAITAMSPSGGSGIDTYSATGLPTGLSIDTGTGVIGGTPVTAEANTADATVTVSDAAGNTVEVSIAFPAVAKGDQTLTGFQYSASSVTFGSTAPTVTAPAGAQTTLSYSATPSSVCTVDPSSGALTLVGAGSCEITATAAGTDDYNEASASYTVTVDDGETPSSGVTLSVTPNAVDEGAGATTLIVTGTLNGIARAEPTALTLSVGASHDTATEGTDYSAVDDVALTIDAGQTSGTVAFTLTPTDDGLVEGDETLSVAGSPSIANLTVTGTRVTILDDDERRVAISPTSLTLVEGDSATYTVVLSSKPTGTVSVTISGTTGTDLRQSRKGLNFGTSKWNEPQTVTVTARQDEDAEDDTVTILHAVSGADYGANGVTADAVSVTIDDDDTVSTGVDLSVSPASIEEGASFTVIVMTGRLNGVTRAEPTTVAVSVGAPDDAATEGTDYATVEDLSLTIPAGRESATAIFVFSPMEDLMDEPDEAVSITGATEVAGFAVTGTTLTINDNDERGVTISPTDLSLTEGASATYTVVLTSEPTGDVTVTPSVSGRAAVTVSAALTFTATDWNQAQTVTISAAHDVDASNDKATIKHAVSGADYGANGATADDVSVTVEDDETAVLLAVNVTAVDEDSSGNSVIVAGTLDGLTRDEPTTLTVSVGASDDAAIAGIDYVAVDDLSLTIPAGQASGVASFTFTPLEDRVDERGEAVSITGATEVAGLAVTGTTLTINDNDERGVTVSPTDLSLTEGASATYTVVLTSEPTGDVTVTLSVRGRAAVTVSAALTFTATDWNQAQTVTVAAAHDVDASNDKATIKHAVSGADYGANGATADDVSVTVEDDETAVLLAVNVTAVDEDSSGNTVIVAGTLDGLTRDEPTTLTVSVGASDDAAIAGIDYVAVDDLSLTIPAGQASGAASFTFTPLEDRVDERVEAVSITGATEVAGFGVTGTTLSITDNDERGVTVSPSDLSVSEGASATYTVVLDTEPTGTVTVTPSLESGDTDVTVSGALTFTATDWDQAQTVTVSAAQDTDSANDTVMIEHAIAGADYGANSVTADDVSVTVEDDETALTLTVDPSAVDEDNSGISVTVSATLDGVPRAGPTTLIVRVGASDDAATEGTDYAEVNDLSLTIRSGQASGTAMFTLTTMDDFIDERDESLSITATIQDAGFEVIGTAVSIDDNDQRGVQIGPTPLTVPEGGDATYTVVLTSEPTGDVTVTPSASGNADVTVSAALTFTATDWDQPQTVTISAAQDTDAANDTAAIGHAVSGADYGDNGVTADDVSVTIEDDETALTLTVDPTAVDEDASGISVAVTGTLDGVPRDGPTTLIVSVGASDDTAIEGTDYAAVNDLSLTIPAGQASGTAIFRLTTMDDLIDEPHETASITGTIQDAGFEVIGTTVSIADNDERGVTVSPSALTLTEGASTTYTLVLDTEPTETVTVTPSVSGSPDVTFEPSSLTFTPSDWDTAQTMTVRATEDDDAYHDSSIVSHAAEGAEYASLVDGAIAVTISDNEVASQGVRPAQVTDVSATATATHVDLSWSAAQDTVLGYRVEASYDGAANWAEVEDNTESTASTYRHEVGLNFAETRHYRVSAVGENGAGLPSIILHASATVTAGGLTATVGMPQGTTDQMPQGANAPVPAIDVCWIPDGVAVSDLGDVAMGMIPDHSSGSTDLSDMPWQSIGSGSSQVDCEDGIGVRMTSISENQRYAFRMRANHAGMWLISNDARAVWVDSSMPLRTVVTAGASGLSGDTPVPAFVCRDYDDPATAEDEAGSFFLNVGFTTASAQYQRYEPVNDFDPATDLTLVNATAQMSQRPYDTSLGYRVRITPSVWGEPVVVSVPADVVTHGETSVGNQASDEFRRETSDAVDCDTSTPEPARRSQVTAAGIEADGDRNGEWSAGEPIRVTLQFDEPVGVNTTDGVPSVTLILGQAAMEATEQSSDGEAATEQSLDGEEAVEVMAPFSHVAHEDTLVFEHLVTADESPIRDITLLADSLSLNGGKMDSLSGPAVDLAHPEAAVAGEQFDLPDLTAGWSMIPDAHEGSESPFEIHLQFSEDADPIKVIGEQNLLGHAFTVTNGSIEAIWPTRDGRGEILANRWAMRVLPASDEPVTISPVVDLACDQPGAICTIDDRPLSEAPSVTVHRIEQALSASDAEVGEGPGAVLVFEITLARAADEPVTVDYETADRTATAGEDYEAMSGTLTFESGQTTTSVQVRVLDDSHDEGEETLTLVVTNASNARIHDGEALGIIVNSDPIPSAWLSRFGRAASDHVAQAVARRPERGLGEEHLKVGGLRLDHLFASFSDPDAGRATSASTHMDLDPLAPGAMQPPGLWAAAGSGARNTQSAGGLGAGTVSPMPTGGSDARWSPSDMAAPYDGGSRASDTLPSLRDALMGSSFFYVHGESDDASSGPFTAWGETASTRFKGSEGSLSLDGEVTTAMLGLDKQYGRWLVGSTLSYSEGEGGYQGSGALGGSMESTLTSLNPYAHFELNETTSLWGVFGYGSGSLRVTPQGAKSAIETNLSNRMAAFGGRGLLSVRTGDAGRFELALRSDALVTRTDSDAVRGLTGAQGATSRVRLMLEGSGSMPLSTGGVLKPSLEAGLRYDGGDAETGAGIELGGGLGYAAGNLSVEVNARALVAHEDTEYEEWGFSGSLAYTPGQDRRGLSMKLGSAWGSTQSGVQSLWSGQDASGMARNGPFEAAQRFQAELGYGIAGRRKAALWVPFIAAQAADGDGQSLRMGVKLTAGPNVEAGLELGRLENGRGEPEHAVQLGGALRW